MNRLKWNSILMVVTILVIAGFQVFWLRENYRKEQHDLEMKTNILFREAIFALQAEKLPLDKMMMGDSLNNVRFDIKRDIPPRFQAIKTKDAEIISMVNAMSSKVRDSLRKEKKNLVISMTNTDMMMRPDSGMNIRFRSPGHPGAVGMVQFLYGVDSLQDSIHVHEIDSAYRIALKKEKIDVPFSVKKFHIEGRLPDWEEPGENMNQVSLGIVKPVTFELQLGNTFGYITKQMLSPLLFSLFLIGVTVASFLILYRNLERQKKLAAIKNEFISNITHELKTPIATVGVAIEALRNFNAMNDPERSKEYLDISQNELHRLSLLVDKVLKLSMFEKKEIELRYENMDLKGVVDEVVTSMRLQLEKYRAKVSIISEGETTLEGDRLHLLSVVFNLLDNALKYSKGEPAILIELKGEPANITMNLKDNGIGIEPEYQDRLFEKFFRVPTGNTHNAKGYGLGLSYVAHVVQRHNGTINVKSEPGIGTLFTITLPKNKA